MKQIAIFNRIFVKTFATALILVGCIVSSASAAIEATLTVKSKTATSAVVTFKNDLVQGMSGDGRYTDAMRVDSIRLSRDVDGVIVQTLSAFTIRGKESKDLSFTSLIAGTKYTAQFDVIKTYSGETGKISTTFTTSGSAASTQAILPVEFVITNTVTGTTKIDLTLRNRSTKSFKVTVVAKAASSGAVVETRETTLDPDAVGKVFFYSGIAAGETYNFTMTGTQVGVSTPYKAVEYNGVKAQASTSTTVGTQVGSTTTTASGSASAGGPSSGGRDPLTGTISIGDGTCGDGEDNDGDGKRDWDGVAVGGIPQYSPDPSCVNKDMTETADDVAKGSWIPCTNKCDLPSVFALLNNLITKLITVILFPIVIIMFVYAGYKYITAQGNPSKKANIKRMLGHVILGMVIILTAWLVVKTVLLVLGYDQTLYFFEE